MAKQSFIELKSTMDDIIETKDAALKKAGLAVARSYSGSGDMATKSANIDKLLEGFSDADKFIIMKFAFLAMC